MNTPPEPKENPITALAVEPPTHTARNDHRHRAQIITTILEQWPDFVDPQQTRGNHGDGEPIPLMPPTYTRTIRELERLLVKMRDDRHHPLLDHRDSKLSLRAAWWHITEWYLNAQRIPNPKPAKRPRSQRRELWHEQRTDDDRPVPTTRVIRHPDALEHAAQRGVQWIADNWQLDQEPFVPTHRDRLDSR